MDMEMEMEVRDGIEAQVERLSAAAEALERMLEREMTLSAAAGSREAELEEKLRVAEATIATLRASRKTTVSGVASLMAKHGIAEEVMEMGALDAALVSLSVEQRIAVKAQMMRSGLVG